MNRRNFIMALFGTVAAGAVVKAGIVSTSNATTDALIDYWDHGVAFLNPNVQGKCVFVSSVETESGITISHWTPDGKRTVVT